VGSKAVFGVLLIGLGLILGYLFVTGRLGAVWSLLTGGSAGGAGSNVPALTFTGGGAASPPQTSSPIPASLAPGPPLNPVTSSQQILDTLNSIENYQPIGFFPQSSALNSIENYQPIGFFPQSSALPQSTTISTMPSVYSPTLAAQTGVTGQIA
jgi:hypothetical protein